MEEAQFTTESSSQNLSKRNVTGVIFSIIALVCIFFGGLPLVLLLLTVVAIALKEYARILRMKGFHPSFSVMMIMGILTCLIMIINRQDLITDTLVLGTILSFLIVLFMGRQPYIANVATTELGFMYGALLPSHIMLIRQIDIDITQNLWLYQPSEGFFLTMFTFFCILTTDTMAYFFGKQFGKHKLSAVISPKKTVEGALWGGFLAILISLLGVFYTKLTLIECTFGGLLITVAAQLGDLSESLIKRDAGVKDSGNTLPGHGGFLDRSDSYVFALPVAYYYFVYFTHGNNAFVTLSNYIKSLIHAAF